MNVKAILLVLLVFSSSAFSETSKESGLRHKLKSVYGSEIALADLKGQFVIVKFWASWCTPCLRDLEHLSDFYKSNPDLPIEIVAVAIDSDVSAAKLALKENSVPFLTLFDSDRTLANALKVDSLANVYVLDRKGRLVDTVPNRIYQDSQFQDFVREYVQP
jgi:thiol-disulfide isomerase/thioredoxin